MKQTDIVIVGAGAVGATLARAVANQGKHSITLVDANRFTLAPTQHPGFDARVIALAKRSEQTLSELGVDLTAASATPITRILVSDQGFLGKTQLQASDYQLTSFGQVVSIQALGAQLFPHSVEGIDLCEGVVVESVTRQAEKVVVTLNDQSQITTKLLVVADGGRSTVSEQLGFEREITDYGQSALIVNVRMNTPHQGVAHERFTPNGPLALLPFTDSCNTEPAYSQCCYSVVWTLSHEDAATVDALPDRVFMQQLQAQMGYRHGIVEQVSERYVYPLSLQRVRNFVAHRSVVIGNSAQTLHPIAGQGFNLGLRDAIDLVTATAEYLDPGEFKALQQYHRARARDKSATIGLTDGLVTLFSNKLLPLAIGRNAGLLAMEFCDPLAQKFVRQTTGLAT